MIADYNDVSYGLFTTRNLPLVSVLCAQVLQNTVNNTTILNIIHIIIYPIIIHIIHITI